jgi:hypothetical protein
VVKYWIGRGALKSPERREIDNRIIRDASALVGTARKYTDSSKMGLGGEVRAKEGRDEKGGGERKRDILSISERVCGPSSRSEGECSGVDASASAINTSLT